MDTLVKITNCFCCDGTMCVWGEGGGVGGGGG